jgi:predicted sugar kinase
MENQRTASLEISSIVYPVKRRKVPEDWNFHVCVVRFKIFEDARVL